MRLLFLISAFFVAQILSAQEYDSQMKKLSQVLRAIDYHYVDDTDKKKIVEQTIISMLKELDPHSVYFSAEQVARVNESLQGNFEGIGVTFNLLNDTIFIISPVSGGPSERVGIRANDRIVKIEGENVAGISIDNQGVRTRLLGRKGTIVNVSIKRKGEQKLLDFSIVRDEIPIYSLDAAYMASEDVGYLKLSRFAAKSVHEVVTAYSSLRLKGAKNVILDLRNNGGGYLNTAINLTDELLAENKLIVYTEGTNMKRAEYTSTNRGMLKTGRLVILVDEGSASASEILSGAIQDWDRGLIVGRRTFGKGLVQRPFSLNDGSMIRLTIARYYTPTGRLIQKSYEKGVDSYRKDIVNRYNNGELLHADSIHFPDSLKYKTLVNSRVVYGGGGIMPDVFVPLDTVGYPDYYSELYRQGYVNDFILEFLDKNRISLLDKYSDFAQFETNYKIDKDFLNLFWSFIEQKIRKKTDHAEVDAEVLKQKVKFDEMKKHPIDHIKAVLARDLWTMNEYFQIINKDDITFQKALEIITDAQKYEMKLKQ